VGILISITYILKKRRVNQFQSSNNKSNTVLYFIIIGFLIFTGFLIVRVNLHLEDLTYVRNDQYIAVEATAMENSVFRENNEFFTLIKFKDNYNNEIKIYLFNQTVFKNENVYIIYLPNTKIGYICGY